MELDKLMTDDKHFQLVDDPPAVDEQRRARVIAVSSGKGGVGKTNITTNLGIALAALNKRVCIFDADIGLANINILIGKTAEFSIEDVLANEKSIEDVLMDGPGGIKIVPASSGLDKMLLVGDTEKNNLLAAYEQLEQRFDYLLIDTSAGIAPTVLSFILSAHDAVIVVSPEPTSLTDAYSLIKTLHKKGFDGEIYTLVNMVLSYEDSVKIFKKLSAAIKKYLHFEIKYLGFVLMDQAVISSVIQQSPIMIQKPDSPASRCITAIAAKFESIFSSQRPTCFSEYWKSVMPVPEPVEQEGSVTPPKEIKEKFFKLQALPVGDLINKITQEMESGAIDQETARDFLQKIKSSFVQRFNSYPDDLKTSIYAALELEGFPEKVIRELHLLLEDLYQKRFQQPLYDIHDIFLQLLDSSMDSASEMRDLYQLLGRSYQRRFDEPIYDMKEIVRVELMAEDFFEDGFADLINTVKEIYADRFGKAYKEPLNLPIAQVEEEFGRLKAQDDLLSEKRGELESLLAERQEQQARLAELISEFSNFTQTIDIK